MYYCPSLGTIENSFHYDRVSEARASLHRHASAIPISVEEVLTALNDLGNCVTVQFLESRSGGEVTTHGLLKFMYDDVDNDNFRAAIIACRLRGV